MTIQTYCPLNICNEMEEHDIQLRANDATKGADVKETEIAQEQARKDMW
jgi:hypothetical protein